MTKCQVEVTRVCFLRVIEEESVDVPAPIFSIAIAVIYCVITIDVVILTICGKNTIGR